MFESVAIAVLTSVLSGLILAILVWMAKKLISVYDKMVVTEDKVDQLEATLNGALKAYDRRLEVVEKEIDAIQEIVAAHGRALDKLK